MGFRARTIASYFRTGLVPTTRSDISAKVPQRLRASPVPLCAAMGSQRWARSDGPAAMGHRDVASIKLPYLVSPGSVHRSSLAGLVCHAAAAPLRPSEQAHRWSGASLVPLHRDDYDPEACFLAFTRPSSEGWLVSYAHRWYGSIFVVTIQKVCSTAKAMAVAAWRRESH